MQERRTRTSRVEWQKRVERWNDSGLSAEEFAAELGIKPGTLRFWKYALGKEKRTGAPAGGKGAAAPVREAFIEVRPAVTVASRSFELELGSERRLRIPADFDPAALERLLSLLERR